MRKLGDRPDGRLLKNIDSMHYIMPLISPNRCDNEAYMTIEIDLSGIEEFVNKYNKERDEKDKYSVFGIIISAALMTVYNRPQLNRFITNNYLFQRNHVSGSFVVKKEFRDDSDETMARVDISKGDNVSSIQTKVNEQINKCKTENDESTDAMNFIQKLPFKKLVGVLARWADRHGLMPKSVIATDPYQCSVLLTNLGSIGLNIGYHHLMNWGTNSLFAVVGKKIHKHVHNRDGSVTTKKIIRLSFTIDERITDGYYCAKSLRLLKKYLEKPEMMLEKLGELEEFY